MASKPMILVLVCFLLVSTKVSSKGEEILIEGSRTYKSSPPPQPPYCPPPPPTVKATQPPPPVVKAPPPPSPPVKASPPPPVAASVPPSPVKKPPRNRQECTPLCAVRCKLHSRKNVCMRACLTCCGRCKCVPPGQHGNKEKCGKCYAGMTTRGGRPKCP